jgi:YD repeat-containing protein
MDEQVFVRQTQTSPAGAGWGIAEVDRLFTTAAADLAVLVRGNGDQETFAPRGAVTALNGFFLGGSTYALATDPVTGQVFLARPGGEIDTEDPTTGNTTVVHTGLSFPSNPLAMAITYVAGARHFVISLDTALVDYGESTSMLRTLMPRTNPDAEDAFASEPAVAAQNDLAFYVSGDVTKPVLYRFRLSDGAPAVEALSLASGGDGSLDPTAPLDRITFGDLHGLAYAPGKGLYIADRQRDVVYLAAVQLWNGEVGGLSAVTRAVGGGASSFLPPLGYRSAATAFRLNQPSALAFGPDGALWITAPFGFALFDPQAAEARWIFFDGKIAGSEPAYRFNDHPQYTSVPVGPTSVLVLDPGNNDTIRLDVTLLSSEFEPTRTIAVDATGATLTDTTQDLAERFDAHGLMQSIQKRTGAAVLSATYVAGTDRIASLVDPTGGSTTFGYDANNKLHTITDPANRVTTLNVNSSGDLASIVEPDSETYAFTYQGHRLTTKASPDGDVTRYTYGADGTITNTSKPAAGDSYTIADAYSQPPQRDANGYTIHVGSYTDPRGVTHTYTVDHHGQLDSDGYTADGQAYAVQYVKPQYLGDPMAAPTAKVFNSTIERVSLVTTNGLLIGTEKMFDPVGRVVRTSTTDPDSGGILSTMTYDANGRVSSFYPSLGNDHFTVTRDAAGRPTSIGEVYLNNPPSRQITFTWNGPNGQADTITEHGVTTTISFDPTTGNPSSTVDTLGRKTTTGYDAAGNVSSAFDGQATQTFSYDANNRLLASTDADNNVTRFGYGQSSCACSQESLVTSIQTPDLAANQAWTMTYGPEGRLATLSDPEGHAESYIYEPTGELHSVTDRLSHTTTIGHDHLGRVQSILDALGRAHQKSYPVPTSTQLSGSDILVGSAGTTVASTDLTTTLTPGDYQIGAGTFDVYSRLTAPPQTNYATRATPQITFYRDATMQVSYGRQFDLALRLTRREDRSGLAFAGTTIFDPQNSGGTGLSGKYTQSQYGYTPNLPLPLVTSLSGYVPSGMAFEAISLGYNNENDLTSSTSYGSSSQDNVNSSGTYTPDTGGRLAGLSYRYTVGSTLVNGVASSYIYEPTSDRLKQVVDPDGEHDFTYDERGLVKSVTVVNEGTYTFAYDSMGRNASLTYPDGHQRIQGYDPEGRTKSRCYNYTNGATSRCYAAVYDADGNPSSMTDPEGTDVFQYDNLNRVTKVTRKVSGKPDVVESYGYNAIGALVTNAPETTGNSLSDQRPIIGGTGSAASPLMSTVNGSSVTVTPVGQVAGLLGATLTFDKQNDLRSVTTGSTTNSYYYDERLHRFARTSGTTTELYFYEGGNIVARLDSAGHLLDGYFFDGIDSPLRISRSGARYYYEVDLAGNVRRLRDATGADLGGYRYTAFGQLETPDSTTPAPSIDQPLRWKGRWFEENVAGGIYDVRARWWSPQMGAFLSVDEFAYHDRNSTLWDGETRTRSDGVIRAGTTSTRLRQMDGSDPASRCSSLGCNSALTVSRSFQTTRP